MKQVLNAIQYDVINQLNEIASSDPSRNDAALAAIKMRGNIEDIEHGAFIQRESRHFNFPEDDPEVVMLAMILMRSANVFHF